MQLLITHREQESSFMNALQLHVETLHT